MPISLFSLFLFLTSRNDNAKNFHLLFRPYLRTRAHPPPPPPDLCLISSSESRKSSPTFYCTTMMAYPTLLLPRTFGVWPQPRLFSLPLSRPLPLSAQFHPREENEEGGSLSKTRVFARARQKKCGENASLNPARTYTIRRPRHWHRTRWRERRALWRMRT